MRGLAGSVVLAASLALAVLAAPAPSTGVELFRDGDRSLDFSGSVRQIVQHSHGTSGDAFGRAITDSLPGLSCLQALRFKDCAAFDGVGKKEVIQGLTRLRMRLDLQWQQLSGVLVYDHELLSGTLDDLGSVLGGGLADDTFLGAEGTLTRSRNLEWRHVLYRGFLRFQGKHFETTVGRQRIPWGVARLWNPIDRFNAIPPLAIEADQSPGVDAIDARWHFNGFDSLQLVYAPGARARDARYAARLQGVVHDYDIGIVGGVFERAVTLGGDLAGNLGGASFGTEIVWTQPHRDVWPVGDARPGRLSDFWQVVGFVDYSIDIGSGLYVLLEHLYNGNALGFGAGKAGPLLGLFSSTDEAPPGVPATLGPFVSGTDPSRFGGSRVVTFAKQQTGVQLGYDLLTSLRGNLVTIYDWDGNSAAFFPSLLFTGWNSVELTLGAQLFAGKRRSQYGQQEPVVFLIAQWFF